MITIIFAPPRKGKTCFMSHCLNQIAFDNDRIAAMVAEIQSKNESGFNLSIPQHCVSANYNLNFSKFGYSVRHSRYINPYRLGFENEFVQTHFNIPFEAIGITEAQKYLNSRMSAYFPEWQSRWYEQHGHDDLDIFLDTQRPNLIDVNVRELSKFIEIVDLKIFCGHFNDVERLEWVIREIPDSFAFEVYMSSGKKDKSCYEEKEVVADYDVFSLYDSQSCKPRFYSGHFYNDFDITESSPTEESIAGYEKFLRMFDDELPEKFYQSRTTKR